MHSSQGEIPSVPAGSVPVHSDPQVPVPGEQMPNQVEAATLPVGAPPGRAASGRPLGVTVVSILNLLAACAFLVNSVPAFTAYVTRKGPSEGLDPVVMNGYVACCSFPFTLLCVLAAVGLMSMRKWGLGLALVSNAALFGLGALWLFWWYWLVGQDLSALFSTFLEPVLIPLALVLFGAGGTIYLLLPTVRRQFR